MGEGGNICEEKETLTRRIDHSSIYLNGIEQKQEDKRGKYLRYSTPMIILGGGVGKEFLLIMEYTNTKNNVSNLSN